MILFNQSKYNDFGSESQELVRAGGSTPGIKEQLGGLRFFLLVGGRGMGVFVLVGFNGKPTGKPTLHLGASPKKDGPRCTRVDEG